MLTNPTLEFVDYKLIPKNVDFQVNILNVDFKVNISNVDRSTFFGPSICCTNKTVQIEIGLSEYGGNKKAVRTDGLLTKHQN